MLSFGLYRVEGDSMLPTYKPGDLLLGRKWFIDPKVGDIVVARIEDRPVIKRIARVNDDQIVLLGDNPSASTDSRAFGPISRDAIIAAIRSSKT